MTSESTIGWRELRWLFVVALSLLGMAAIFATALAGTAAAKPKLELKSFQSDRTIQPGQTSALKISCGKGFQFLSTRFRSTTLPTDPSNPATRPAFELLGMVPEEKGTQLTLNNVGSVPVTVLGTADCTRVKGKIAREGGSAEASAKKKKPKLTTYVNEKSKKVSGSRARAAKTTTLKVTCNKKNSIPTDIGFKSKSSEFAGASYFKKKGDLGIKGRFNSNGNDKLKLYAACTKGKLLKLKGKVTKGTLAGAATAPTAKTSAKTSKLTINYGQTEGALQSDVPFTGVDRFVDTKQRRLLSAPVPTSLPSGDLWLARGYLEPTSPSRGTGLAGPAGVFIPIDFLKLFGVTEREQKQADLEVFLRASLAGRLDGPWTVKDGRAPGALNGVNGGGGPGGGGGGGDTEKCEDGKDNDGDGAIDAADPGCQTGPGGTYDPKDHGEDDQGFTINCAAVGFQTATSFTVGTSMIRHRLRNLTNGANVIDRGSGAGDFDSGLVSLGTSLCGSGSNVSVEWTRSGTTIAYTVTVGATGPNGIKNLNVAANTR